VEFVGTPVSVIDLEPLTVTAFRPLSVPTSGRLPAVACTACLPFPDLSPQYPTGSLLAVAGTVPSLF
jgi:hypothetical protein